MNLRKQTNISLFTLSQGPREDQDMCRFEAGGLPFVFDSVYGQMSAGYSFTGILPTSVVQLIDVLDSNRKQGRPTILNKLWLCC